MSNPLPSIMYFLVFCIAIAGAFFITLSSERMDFIRLNVLNAPHIAKEQFTFMIMLVFIVVISSSFIMVMFHMMVDETMKLDQGIEESIDAEVKDLIGHKRTSTFFAKIADQNKPKDNK